MFESTIAADLLTVTASDGFAPCNGGKRAARAWGKDVAPPRVIAAPPRWLSHG